MRYLAAGDFGRSAAIDGWVAEDPPLIDLAAAVADITIAAAYSLAARAKRSNAM
jgi:hypothetical protein